MNQHMYRYYALLVKVNIHLRESLFTLVRVWSRNDKTIPLCVISFYVFTIPLTYELYLDT